MKSYNTYMDFVHILYHLKIMSMQDRDAIKGTLYYSIPDWMDPND